MKRRILSTGAVAVVAFLVGSLWAHHSSETYFDLKTTYLLRGRISAVNWSNPHAYAFMDVTTCKSESWAVELASPATLFRTGLRTDMLLKGTPISIYASPAKFASSSPLREVDEAWKAKHLVLGGCIVLPDGRRSEYGDGPRCERPKQDEVIGIEQK
jgi:hypothetical protein